MDVLNPFKTGQWGPLRRGTNRSFGLLVVLLIATVLVMLLVLKDLLASGSGNPSGETASRAWNRVWPQTWTKADTLVIYTYSSNDPEYVENFKFFIRNAVKAGDGCDYRFILQGLDPADPVVRDSLPPLPQNAEYIAHDNTCYDIGTIGWYLKSTKGIWRYKYFFFLNSSVRGPFIPSYLYQRMHWTEPMLSLLSKDVKLVGSSINCAAVGSPMGLVKEVTPHVQSYAFATDQTGLQVLLAAPEVFQCYEQMWEVVAKSELGMSEAILSAGYNFASLMWRYHGVDWRDRRWQSCNGATNPLQDKANDGTSSNPIEVLFVKVKRSMVEASWESVLEALHIADAMDAAEGDSALRETVVLRNRFDKLVQQRRVDAQRRGPECFDYQFYASSSPHDLGTLGMSNSDLWAQFLSNGLREGRPYRFNC